MIIKSEHLEGGPRSIVSSRPDLQYREFKATVSSRPAWESQTKTPPQQLCFVGVLFVVISGSCAWRADGNVCDISHVPWLGCIWIVSLRALCYLHPRPAAILNVASLNNKYTVENMRPESVHLHFGPSAFTYQRDSQTESSWTSHYLASGIKVSSVTWL